MEKKIPEFLKNLLQEQYGIENTQKIINGYNAKRFVTLRVNTLKTDIITIKEKLTQQNIEWKTVSWSKDALIIKNVREDKIRTLDIYENGEIYLQSLSSMLPPIFLEPKPQENILDMTAAPGGKTTQMAAISNNKAFITACEMNAIRAEKLKYNIQKQGANGVYVMITDARKLDDFFSFDKILLDAPCSGSGTINLDENDFKKTFTQELIHKSEIAQLALLKKAIKLLKPGNEMIYSTCSILKSENEEILRKAIKGTNVKIVPINLEGIKDIPLLPVEIDGTICVCPNELYEGFFVAKIQKK